MYHYNITVYSVEDSIDYVLGGASYLVVYQPRSPWILHCEVETWGPLLWVIIIWHQLWVTWHQWPALCEHNTYTIYYSILPRSQGKVHSHPRHHCRSQCGMSCYFEEGEEKSSLVPSRSLWGHGETASEPVKFLQSDRTHFLLETMMCGAYMILLRGTYISVG